MLCELWRLPGIMNLLALILVLGADVKSFGAVGDGVTDDAPAIQMAIDAGGTVTFPTGTYLVGRGLLMKPGVTLDGSNASLKAGFPGTVIGCIADNVSVMNCTIQGLGGTAIEVSGTNLVVSGNRLAGFTVGISITGPAANVVVKNNRCDTVTTGISLSTWEEATMKNVVIERNVVVLRKESSNTGIGYANLANFRTSPVNLAIRDNIIYQDGVVAGASGYASGIRLARGNDVLIAGNYISNLTGRGIDLYGDMRCVWMRGNYIADVGLGVNPLDTKTPKAFAQGIAVQMGGTGFPLGGSMLTLVANTVKGVPTGILLGGTIADLELVRNDLQTTKDIDDRRAK